MRQAARVVLAGAIGVLLLPHLGLPVGEWQFWVVLASLVVVVAL